jgi:hypothetical protein
VGAGRPHVPQSFDRFQLHSHPAQSVSQRIVEFARHAVALAADRQLFQRRSIVDQFAVGLLQSGALLAHLRHDARDDVTHNHE